MKHYTKFIDLFNAKMEESSYKLKKIRFEWADGNVVGLYKKVLRPTHQSIRI